MAGRHSKAAADARAPKRKGLFTFASAFVVTTLVAVLAVRWITQAAESCGEETTFTVDADPSIAPALTEFVTEELPTLQGPARCVRPHIRAVKSHKVAGNVRDKAERPDVWIPDSTLWLRRANAKTAAVPSDGTSIASSPIVLASTENAASDAGWPERNPTWSELLSGTGIAGTPDPSRDTAAVLALMGIEKLAWNETERTKAMQLLTKNTFGTKGDPYRHLPDGGTDPIVASFPSSEQAVFHHNESTDAGSGTTGSVVAAYPEVPTAWLDYPFVVLEGTGAKQREAAFALQQALDKKAARTVMSRHGFRGSNRKLTGPGAADKRISADAGKPLDTPGAKAATKVLQKWATLSSAARLLVALDVSGSMEKMVPGTPLTRMQVAENVLSEAMRLLRPNTELTLWEFSTNRDGELPYREVAPWKPASQHIADGLPDKVDDLTSGPEGNTGLYDTTLAAVKEVKRGWDPAMLNLVLVVTDGKNYYENGLTREKLLAKLGKVADRSKPTPVIFVGLGTEIDGSELQDIAKATGGQVHVSEDIKKARELFYTVLQNMSRG
ncbi:substrate-binding domain-containing protein [Haloechinothrix halophila]|uniref:substrate-binding domain-containing protein n=1 Tax=Haloechinothrix halophila TaxID=1069073 RepID=UPI0004149268|nr:substrate-binding domain-containing protein [Haloechinothrix halophila]